MILSSIVGFQSVCCPGTLVNGILIEDLKRELDMRFQKEADLKSIISEKDKLESQLRGHDEAKQQEMNLESELANVWAMVAKMRNSGRTGDDGLSKAVLGSDILLQQGRNGIAPPNAQEGPLAKDENYDLLGWIQYARRTKKTAIEERGNDAENWKF